MDSPPERAGGVATPTRYAASCAIFSERRSITSIARLYLDPDRVDRFLVADEVGLGKTWAAKSVIAEAVVHLWDQKKRIDVPATVTTIRRLELRGLLLPRDPGATQVGTANRVGLAIS